MTFAIWALAGALVAIAAEIFVLIRRAQSIRSLDDRRYALIETLPDALFIVDDAWRITHANERAESLLRHTAPELIGKRIDDIFDPLASELYPQMQWVRATGTPLEFVQEFEATAQSIEVRIQPSKGEMLVYLRDVTERRGAEKRLREGERRLRLLLQQVPALLWTADLDMRMTSASGTALSDYALVQSEILGQSADVAFDSPEIRASLRRVFTGEAVRYESSRNGRWLQHEIEPLRNVAGEIVGAIGAALDVTEMKTNATLLAEQARTDQLTRLPNRLALEEALDALLATAADNKNRLAVLFLDIDRFKIINDSLGHRAGDAVLCDVADRLNELLDGRARIFRPGGDEFVILHGGDGECEDVPSLAAEILRAFEPVFTFHSRELHVTASIGASLYPDNALRSEDLIKQADAAMYRAKDNGRKNAQFYDRAMHAYVVERMGIELDLRQAMSRAEFDLFYQPIVDLQTGKILSGEALIRWTHPSLGVLLPERFVPVAEEIGAIVQMTRWVLEQASRHLASIRKQTDPSFRLTVNVSALDLAQPDFSTTVRETLAFHGLDAGALDFEVTEGSIVNDTAVATLTAMRDAGARIVIDDFGMGYSSLGYVRNLPLDAIKIDRRFVMDAAHNPQDQAVIKAIATLAQNLSLQIVAEGVETEAQREFLVSAGVSVAQGFFFSRPVTGAQFAHMVRAQNANASGDPQVIDFAKYRSIEA